jgi:hypothetical protein
MNPKLLPYYWLQDRIAVRINGPVQQLFHPLKNHGMKVMDEDWDNLFILDGCRADLFERTVNIDMFDSYEVMESLGSCTPQWLTRNFSDQSFGDTIYVTGNAFVSKIVPDRFHDVIDIKDTIEGVGVVHPKSIAEAVRSAFDRYPNKRFIVHYVQPHMPFIETPELVYQRDGNDARGYGGKADPLHVHEALATGAIRPEDWWEGYQQNLVLGFEYALELAKEIGGMSVFTSDHGNMAGERGWPVPIRHYGHPRNLRASELVEVPWAVLSVGERRRCVDDGTNMVSGADVEDIKRRLNALGYNTDSVD